MNSNRAQFLQGPFLNSLRAQSIPVFIYLVNGNRLRGLITSFDQYALMLRNEADQLVYKHAISTVVPDRRPEFVIEGGVSEDEKVQDVFLDAIKTLKQQVRVHLINGIRLEGVVTHFDQYCLILEGADTIQMVYKHATATVVAQK